MLTLVCFFITLKDKSHCRTVGPAKKKCMCGRNTVEVATKYNYNATGLRVRKTGND